MCNTDLLCESPLHLCNGWLGNFGDNVVLVQNFWEGLFFSGSKFGDSKEVMVIILAEIIYFQFKFLVKKDIDM